MRAQFEKFGPIKSIRVKQAGGASMQPAGASVFSPQSSGVAYVDFETHEAAELARSQLNGKKIGEGDHILSIEYY